MTDTDDATIEEARKEGKRLSIMGSMRLAGEMFLALADIATRRGEERDAARGERDALLLDLHCTNCSAPLRTYDEEGTLVAWLKCSACDSHDVMSYGECMQERDALAEENKRLREALQWTANRMRAEGSLASHVTTPALKVVEDALSGGTE